MTCMGDLPKKIYHVIVQNPVQKMFHMYTHIGGLENGKYTGKYEIYRVYNIYFGRYLKNIRAYIPYNSSICSVYDLYIYHIWPNSCQTGKWEFILPDVKWDIDEKKLFPVV